MSKIKSTTKIFHRFNGRYNYPFKTSKYSIFAAAIYRTNLNSSNNVTEWERLTDFMIRRLCSRYQANQMANKRLIAVDSFKNRLYVCELCPDEIDDYLGCDNRCQ